MRRRAAFVLLALAAAGSAAAAVPRPEDVFGFAPGADRKLADHAAIVRYFQALDQASPRVTVIEFGRSVKGRPLIAAVITSEANHRRLARLREISRTLARARVGEAEARGLLAEGRAVVWIDAGLHATEVAPAQHAPELAYRVATEETPEMRRIREDVVLVLAPVVNPDGLDEVAAWYRRNLGTPYEVAPMVEPYHAFADHDNNRDFYMFNLPESRAIARLLYEEWLPQIVYNHHQTAPFPARIFVPPFADPMNPNIPPQVMRGIQVVGDAITARLEAEGKRGAVSRMQFDTWWNGGLRTAPSFHNMVGILTETALWRYATPREYDPAKLPEKFRDGTPARTPTTSYPSPWGGGTWRLRDAVDYVMTASLATLDVASRRREEWLWGIYQMGRAAIRAGEAGAPYAYVIPPGQADEGAAFRLVDALRTAGVEVHVARAGFRAGERSFPEGTRVVLMAQPFRAHAKDVLEVQRYPAARAGGAPPTPYDVTGWTLPAQMGVAGEWVESPFTADLEPVSGAAAPAGTVTGSGEILVADSRANASFRLAARAMRAGADVSRASAPFRAAGRAFAAGAFLVRGLDEGRARTLAAETGLTLTALPKGEEPASVPFAPRRVGVYRPFVPLTDEGWVRWVLERHEVPYTGLRDAEVRAGGLRSRYDVIVLPDASWRTLLHGHPPGVVPPEFAGGLGLAGARALEEFVRAGGTLVALDSAAELPLELFALPLRNVVRDLPRSEYVNPGALVRLQVDAAHPLAWGAGDEIVAFAERGPVMDTEEEDEDQRPPRVAVDAPVRAVARFPDKDVLYSGFLHGEGKIAGKIALAEVPLGQGRLVLFGFRPQFRGQSHGTFKLLLNALY